MRNEYIRGGRVWHLNAAFQFRDISIRKIGQFFRNHCTKLDGSAPAPGLRSQNKIVSISFFFIWETTSFPAESTDPSTYGRDRRWMDPEGGKKATLM